MMRAIKYLLLTLLTVVVLYGCTDHRDLHVAALPMFIVKNDWSAAQLNPEGATVMFFARPEPYEPLFNNPNRHKLYLDPNLYDILVFNEVMFSPSTTNLDGVVYRGTDQFSTFGAYAYTHSVSPIFGSEPGEVMVGYGYPSVVAAREHGQKEVLPGKQYIMKYQNGKDGNPVYADFDADSVEMVPLRVTRQTKIIAHVTNLKRQSRVSGTLRGFAEGVLLATRQPDGANAAYTFDLNSAAVDAEVEGGYIVQSKSFANFGPWWNDYPGERRYTLDIVATVGNEIARQSIDVTESDGVKVTRSVGDAIKKIQLEEAKLLSDGTPPAMDDIVIEVWFALPEIGDGSIDVGVGDWGSDIIISIPMGT